ncbi:MAG: bacteriohemerythrin [Treponema sp.]|nr:bacteriohemerythrin [Treponema sp.]
MTSKTDLITWSSTFSVGVKLIDDQHKGLLDLVNDMFNHATGNEAEEREYFASIIQQAVQYVKVHFSTEEKIMLHTKFPGYAEHKKTHDSFVLTLVENIEKYNAGRRLILSDFTKFLKEWILTHVAIMDKMYFSHFKSIATRQDDGKLHIDTSNVANIG